MPSSLRYINILVAGSIFSISRVITSYHGGGDTPLRPGSSSKTRFDTGAYRGVQGRTGAYRGVQGRTGAYRDKSLKMT